LLAGRSADRGPASRADRRIPAENCSLPYVIADDLPGAHTGIAALLAKRAGFEALYMSGAAMSANMGLPDLGMITVDDVSWYIRQVARAAGLPTLVNGDTGYGEALNVMHMVRTFEEEGARTRSSRSVRRQGS
jgi:2-methylisocitrate lyase-like PEP mutase family enzyme